MDIHNKQTVTVLNRQRVIIDGVKNVIGFDESYVTLETDLGKITIEGAEMRIESLTKDDGKIDIYGKIDGVYYYTDKERKGIFKRMLG